MFQMILTLLLKKQQRRGEVDMGFLSDEQVADLLEDSEGEYEQDIKTLIKEYIDKCGAPAGSFYDMDVLTQIAKEMKITYNDKEVLKEAIDEIREDDDLISEVVNNNLKFFGDID